MVTNLVDGVRPAQQPGLKNHSQHRELDHFPTEPVNIKLDHKYLVPTCTDSTHFSMLVWRSSSPTRQVPVAVKRLSQNWIVWLLSNSSLQ